jgi:hypothetical protein
MRAKLASLLAKCLDTQWQLFEETPMRSTGAVTGLEAWNYKQCRLRAWWRRGGSLPGNTVTPSVWGTCSRTWCWCRDLSGGLDYWISAAPSILTRNCFLQLAGEIYVPTGLSWRRCGHIWKAVGRCPYWPDTYLYIPCSACCTNTPDFIQVVEIPDEDFKFFTMT